MSKISELVNAVRFGNPVRALTLALEIEANYREEITAAFAEAHPLPESQVKQDFDARLKQFADALEAKLRAGYAAQYPESKLPEAHIEAHVGPKYVRIVKRDGASASAYAFINKENGDILKPASYKAPAKHARGNIYADDFGLSCCHQYSVAYLKGGR